MYSGAVGYQQLEHEVRVLHRTSKTRSKFSSISKNLCKELRYYYFESISCVLNSQFVFHFLSQEFVALPLSISCAHGVLTIYAVVFGFLIEGEKKKVLLFLLSQSTINPVDAVYQPSPLEQPVISAMPSHTVIPPGTEEKLLEIPTGKQDAAALQMEGLHKGGLFLCHMYAVQVLTAPGGAKQGKRAGSLELPQPSGNTASSSVDKPMCYTCPELLAYTSNILS